jgi:hypothetical protein
MEGFIILIIKTIFLAPLSLQLRRLTIQKARSFPGSFCKKEE